MTPAFAADDADSLPLHVIPTESLGDFLTSSPHADWLLASGFEAGLGEMRLLPGPGGICGAVAGLGTEKARRRSRFGLARAFSTLPAGDWHLDGPLTPAQADEAALAALLQAYRFDRYRPAKSDKAAPRIKAPKGVDAARLIAMAAGEFLTRDLINTPAQDMGPDQLEQAVRDLATAHGASITVTSGDAPYGSPEHLSLFAVGTVLFLMTLSLNLVSGAILRRYREEYS